ncbi:MAG: hypothetical protein WC389_17875 [Lutibacter sp.]|jgi:hypothetical protein
MKITLKHPINNSIKKIKAGFSWTTLFFEWLVPIFRGDAKYFCIMLICNICSLGLTILIFPFIYNKLCIKKLLEQGYLAADNYTEIYLKSKELTL